MATADAGEINLEAPPAEPTPTLRGRWRYGAGLLAIGVVAQTCLWIHFAEDSTFSKMSVLWVWPATLFAFSIWWTFFSGWSWGVRLGAWGLLMGAGAAFNAVFRIDGSDGDMIPTLAYRWSPTPEERAAAYWRQQSPPATGVPPEATVAETPVAEAPLVAGDDDWPGYRGAQRDGVVRGAGFRKDWDARPPQELWRHPVGLGWSSFAVIGDLAITQEQRDADETVVAYDLATGQQRWIHADPVRYSTVAVNGGDGPRATPVIDGPFTYTVGGTGVLNCLRTRTGERVWTRNILEDAGKGGKPADNIQWGVSAAPLVVGELVIALAGGTAGRSVLAYDRQTGAVRWADGQFPASYGSPRVEELLGVPQVVTPHGTGFAGLALEDGRVLWNFPWENMPKVNSAQPIKLDDQSLLVGIGYGIGATRVKLSADAGDWTAKAEWKSNKFKLKFNDAVFRDGFAYGLDDGILTCLDTATGKTKWKGGRYGYGQLLLHEDTLLVLGEDGAAALVAAQPERFAERARLKMLDGTTWNHPAVAHGKLLVRNGTEAACYDVAP